MMHPGYDKAYSFSKISEWCVLKKKKKRKEKDEADDSEESVFKKTHPSRKKNMRRMFSLQIFP